MAESSFFLQLSGYSSVILSHNLSNITSSLSIHLLMGIWSISISWLLNNAAMNIRAHISFQISVFVISRYINSNKNVGSQGSSIFSFLRNHHGSCTNLHIPTHSVQELLFLTSSPIFLICTLFDDSHSDRCEVISNCSFELHSPET